MSLSLEELRAQTPAQLENQVRTLREERFWLHMQRSVGQLSQWHLLKNARRDIARVMTVLQEKRAQEQAAQEKVAQKAAQEKAVQEKVAQEQAAQKASQERVAQEQVAQEKVAPQSQPDAPANATDSGESPRSVADHA